MKGKLIRRDELEFRSVSRASGSGFSLPRKVSRGQLVSRDLRKSKVEEDERKEKLQFNAKVS